MQNVHSQIEQILTGLGATYALSLDSSLTAEWSNLEQAKVAKEKLEEIGYEGCRVLPSGTEDHYSVMWSA